MTSSRSSRTKSAPARNTSKDHRSLVELLEEHSDARLNEQNGDESMREQLKAMGRLIRATRKGRYSLEELAARSTVSAGLISQIERGVGNPSYLTLGKLANALGLSVTSFYQGPSHKGGYVVRAGERKRLAFPNEGLIYELLMPDFNSLNSPVYLLKVTFPPGFDNSGISIRGQNYGKKVVLVLKGRLNYALDGHEFVLNPGDSITHDSSIDFIMQNRGAIPVEAIALMDRSVT